MNQRKEAQKEDEKQVVAVVEGTATLPSASDEEKGTETQLQNIDLSEQSDPGLASPLQCPPVYDGVHGASCAAS